MTSTAQTASISPAGIRICAGASTVSPLWCSPNSNWIPSQTLCFCSAAGNETESRPCIGRETGSYCCIKLFVMGRKNFLFMNTPGGAEAGAVIYSIIETAKANGLDPYRYLCYILSTAPRLDRAVPDWVSPLLPANAPDACRK